MFWVADEVNLFDSVRLFSLNNYENTFENRQGDVDL